MSLYIAYVMNRAPVVGPENWIMKPRMSLQNKTESTFF